MDAFVFIALCLLLLISVWLLKGPTRTPGSPPVLPGVWPVIGRLPSFKEPFTAQISKLIKEYGSIFTWCIGTRKITFMSDFKMIKEAFSKPELSDRPGFYTFMMYSFFKNIGILNSNGLQWVRTRKFVLKHLKEFGFGKSSLETVIEEEAECLIKEFNVIATGKSTNLPWSINVAVLNIIWKMAADRHYDVQDKEIQEFEKLISKSLNIIQGPVVLYDMYPYLEHISPNFVKRWLGAEDVIGINEKMKVLFMETIGEHEATLDVNHPRDYIDAYLIEMKNPTQPDDFTTFSKEDLVSILINLFVDGSETTASTLRWLFLYLTKYSDVQKKIHDEIDSVVARDRPPSLSDKSRLPYTNAVIHEILRVTTFAIFGVPHYASSDTTIGGYTIKKGHVLMACIEECHKNPSYWDKPNDFYPEHFLNDDGSFNGKKDGFLPFSIGRRVCLGEGLAMMELFLFTTILLQKFTFSAPEGVTLSVEPDPTQPLFHVPPQFPIVINKRDK